MDDERQRTEFAFCLFFDPGVDREQRDQSSRPRKAGGGRVGKGGTREREGGRFNEIDADERE